MKTPLHFIKQAVWQLASEHTTPARLGIAVGIGVYVGVSPFFGFHTIFVIGLAWIFRLNKVAIVLGTQISNPFFALPIIWVSIQLGTWLRVGQWSRIELSQMDMSTFKALYWNWDTVGALFLDWLLGSVIVGIVLAALLGSVTGWVVKTRRKKLDQKELENEAAS